VIDLERAIEAFRASQAEVYKSDPSRLLRDSRVARRSIHDYTGRWFFELIQNCEDARATTVEVRVTDTALYVGDNGDGFSPRAVKSISGTDYSDKPVGTIGRKGVGFKAVYEITATPQVFTVQDGGLEFDPSKATDWLDENGLLNDREHVPYEWLPFYTSRSEAEASDPVLGELRGLTTVLRLPLRSKERLERATRHLSEWPAVALLVFEHIGVLRVRGPDVSYEARVTRSEDAFVLIDSRLSTETRWKVVRQRVSPPSEYLASLDADDRERASEVGFLIAAPVHEDGGVRPTQDFPPVHVFYPTEECAPLRLLLHAEFLVKTDRTAIISVAENQFNSWTADILADLVISYINDSYRPQSPSAHLRLLQPLHSRDEHPVARELWERITRIATERLVLPDVNGQATLRLGQGHVLAVSVEPALARRILACTPIGSRIVHEDVDNDKEAAEALRALGCTRVTDANVLDTVERYAAQKIQDREWIWAAVQWLAHWLAKGTAEPDRQQRKERLGRLPIVPAGGRLLTPESLADKIVTWRKSELDREFPEWVPLVLVDDWFRDHITTAREGDPVKALAKELGVEEPGKDVLLRAVGRAIRDYWEAQEGDPERFLRFFLTREDWREVARPPSEIRQCPIPARVSGQGGIEWVPAEKAHFGSAWGEHDVARVYEGVDGVPWAELPSDIEPQRAREVLETLGVVCYSRVLQDQSAEAQNKERLRISPLLPLHTRYEAPNHALVLDRVAPQALSPEGAASLMKILSHNWKQYYERRSTVSVSYQYYSWYDATVPAYWWVCVLTQLVPPLATNDALPAPLRECWLPDQGTRRAVGDLIPMIDLGAFGNRAEDVRQWLCEVVRVRQALVAITVDEWRKLLSERVPEIMPAENMPDAPPQRDKVTGWYESCLRSLDGRQDVAQRALSTVPLLSRRGDQWDYRDANGIWLADDQDLASAFRDDCWQIELPGTLRPQAKTHFGLRALSEHVRVEFHPGRCLDKETAKLRQELDEVLPCVFVWRCSQTSREPERLREDLVSLRVSAVEDLSAHLALDGVAERTIERRWGRRDKDLLVSARTWNSRLTSLANALADALEVKTEADFYENLLRCDSDDARKAKLLAKGVTEQEMDRLLRIFHQSAEPGLKSQVAKPPDEGRPTPPTVPEPVDDGSALVFHQSAEPGLESQVAKPPDEGRPTPPTVSEPIDDGSALVEGGDGGARGLRLKDPDIAEIEISSEICGRAASAGRDKPAGTGDQHHPSPRLSEEEKREIEEHGRRAAGRKLEEMGYSVRQMPYENPGYDIRATKDGKELRIEIKAHRHTATVVEMTTREMQEYYEQQSNEAIRWELWNVENLAADVPARVTITRYDVIPDEALDTRQFAVDLRRCVPMSPADSV